MAAALSIRTSRTLSSLVRPQRLHSILRPALRPLSTSLVVRATGGVSQQPGSKSFSDLGQNAKEEAKKVAGDLASTISGANATTAQTNEVGGGVGASLGNVKEDIDSMTSILEQVPQRALLFGAAGLLPYAGTSLATIYLARQAGAAANAVGEAGTAFDAETALALLHHVEMLQVQYGAIILSFLGAIHWGYEFAKFGGSKGTPRYLLGIAPVLAGWGSLLLPGQIALVGQWAAFTGMWWADQTTTSKGWAPRWYSTYRFGLTAVVGTSILISLGGAQYYSPGPRTATSTAARLDAVSSENETFQAGDMQIQKADDAFVRFTNIEKEKQAAREEEEKKKKEEKEKRVSEKKEAEAHKGERKGLGGN